MRSFSRAKWSELRSALAATDWTAIIDTPDVDGAVTKITEHLLTTVKAFIRYRKCAIRKMAHPWLTDKCVGAVAQKCSAAGTPEFAEAQKNCNSVLNQAYHDYLKRLREKLATLPKGSKRWWKLNRELLNKQRAVS